MSDIIEEIMKFLFEIICEFICYYTGEIVLFIITFGKHKPRWDYYSDDSIRRFYIFTEISFWIGCFFWILVIFLIYMVLKYDLIRP